MFSKLKNKLHARPITTKVTLWYTLFMLLLIIIILFIFLYFSSFFDNIQARRDLQENVQKKVHLMMRSNDNNEHDERKDIQGAKDGVYLLLYDKNGNVIQGLAPSNFNLYLPFKENNLTNYTISNNRYYYYDLRVIRPNSDISWVRGVIPVERASRTTVSLLLGSLIVMPLFLIFASFGGYRIIKRAFRPIRTISKTVKEIGDNSDFSKRIPIPTDKDEIHQMVSAFNQCLEQIDQSFDRERQFTSDASHELRTPIAVILSESEFGMTRVNTLEDAKTSFEVIHKQSIEMQNLVQHLLFLARITSTTALNLEPFDLPELIDIYLDSFKKILNKRKITCHWNSKKSLIVYGDRDLSMRAISNIIDNAIKFTNQNIWIDLKEMSPFIRLSIADDGPPISPQDQQKIWNSFYQVDSSRSRNNSASVGLGLSIAKKVMTLQNGKITLDDVSVGTKQFNLYFRKNNQQ